MSKNNSVTKEDFDLFYKSPLNPESKENTAKNINKGVEYETAFNTPHGKILIKDLEDILVGELTKITSHRHNPDKTIPENYDNLMVAINKYKTAESMKVRWEGILKTKEASLNRIKKVSNEIKKNRNL